MILEKVKRIIEEYFKIIDEDITLETNFFNDLGFDSLDYIDMAMSVEDEFEIELPDEELEKIKTVDDLVKFIENNTK